MPTYDLPAGLGVSAEMWRIDARTRSGGASIEGREQVVASGLGLWVARVNFPTFSRENVRISRALLARLEGRANLLNIGPCDCRNAVTQEPFAENQPYSDETLHSDDTGWLDSGSPTTIRTAASLGATSIDVRGSTNLDLAEGAYLGLGGYLYIVESVTSNVVVVGAPASDYRHATLSIRPRLRAAADVDDVVEWEHPRCPMRLLTDDSGALDLSLGRIGTMTLDLIEVWP